MIGKKSIERARTDQVASGETAAAIGRTILEATIATATNEKSTPRPTSSSRCPVPSPAPTIPPITSAATAPAPVSSPATGAKRASLDGGRTAPSRTAAIGGTRVALIAGRSDAASVTRMPISSETTTVRVAKTVPFRGRSIPKETKSESRPLARTRPRKSPTTDASTPTANASLNTDASTCRRLAPIVRSVASSRVRCAIVIESVFAITNEPTNSATNTDRPVMVML